MDRHDRALRSFLAACRAVPSVAGVLAYGSYARGEYRPRSDIDLVVLLSSRRLSEGDVRALLRALRRCLSRYRVRIEADFLLDSEIEPFNRGVLLDGRAASDVAMYRREGRVLYGTDFRRSLRVPPSARRSASLWLSIVEEHFKRWLFHHVGRRVPWWFPSWASTVALNAIGVLELSGRDAMLSAVRERFPSVWRSAAFRKVRGRPRGDVLRPDEFLALLRALRQATERTTP